MFIVKVWSEFSSAHNLRGYKGQCEDLHGHNWKVEVAAYSNELNETGFVVDFRKLKESLKNILSRLDHKHLNDIDPFTEINPTSENISKYIFDEMAAKGSSCAIKEVTVWETATSSATYSKDCC